MSIVRVAPAGWQEILVPLGMRDDSQAFRSIDGLAVIVSQAVEQDGKRWLHVSCSRRDRLPSWEDLGDVKAAFLGDEVLAIQVLPKKSQYVNLHPFVLHLWRCLDSDPCPDFTRGSGQI